MQYGFAGVGTAIALCSGLGLSLLWQKKDPTKVKGNEINLAATLNEKALRAFLSLYSTVGPTCLSEMGFKNVGTKQIETDPTDVPDIKDVELSIKVNGNNSNLTIRIYIPDSTTINHATKTCKCDQQISSKCSIIAEMTHFIIRDKKIQRNILTTSSIYKFSASHVLESISEVKYWESTKKILGVGAATLLLFTKLMQESTRAKACLISGFCVALYKAININDICRSFPFLLPSKITRYPVKKISKSEQLQEEINQIQKYGRLRGRVDAIISRSSFIANPQNSEILEVENTKISIPHDILVQIALVFFNEKAIEDFKKLQHTSRSFWKACSEIVISYEKSTLSRNFSTKMEQFPLDLRKSILKFADQSIGILTLNPNILKEIKPSENADPTGLPEFCGIHTVYNTEKPKSYPYASSDVKYFKHPHFDWATTMIDFISWPIIENFALLYIEDPFKRPSLAIPYESFDSMKASKGIFFLQRFRVNEGNKEFWLLIDKPVESSKAKLICFLHDFDIKSCCANCNTTDSELIKKNYLNWLNEFLSGKVDCKDLPSSVKGFHAAESTERHIRHYVKRH